MANAHMAMPFPCLPASLWQFDEARGGSCWRLFCKLLQPVLLQHKLEWRECRSAIGHHLWVIQPQSQDHALQATVAQVGQQCEEAVGRALLPTCAHVGAPHTKGRQVRKVPWGAVDGAKDKNSTRSLCAMLACVVSGTVERAQLPHVYPAEALSKQATKVEPTLVEDQVEQEVQPPTRLKCACIQTDGDACYGNGCVGEEVG